MYIYAAKLQLNNGDGENVFKYIELKIYKLNKKKKTNPIDSSVCTYSVYFA